MVATACSSQNEGQQVAAVVFSGDLTECACLGVDHSTNHLIPINMRNRSRDTL